MPTLRDDWSAEPPRNGELTDMPANLAVIAKRKVTPEEIKLLSELTKPNAKIEVSVSGEITLKDWKDTTGVVCRALVRAQMQGQKLFPVLGRLLVIAEENTAIWEGYESFKKFLAAEIEEKFGISVSSAYETLHVAKRLPHLQVGQVESIPRRNMRVYLQAVPVGSEKNKESVALMEKAAELPEKEFREHCENLKLIEKGETAGEYVKYGTNKARGKKIRAWYADPRVQAKCGSAREDIITEFMIAECSAWLTDPIKEELAELQKENQNGDAA